MHGGTRREELEGVSRDTLSDVLRAVRLRGAVFYYIDGSSPWMAEAPPARETIPAIMPGADHMIEFHGVVEGSCWAAIVGEPPLRLDERDVILFPHGDPHVISSAPGMRPQRVDKEIYFAPRPPQLPYALSLRGSELTTARLDGGGGDRTILVCGFLGLDVRPFNPLVAALPRILHLPASRASDWVARVIDQAVVESNNKRPGGEAVLERLSEMMFVDAARRYLDSLPEDATGWLAGLRDRYVGKALGLMHERPDHAWSVDDLAREVGLSRSALHERFVQYLGQPPMQYLASWRIQLGARMLRESNRNVATIALDVGYESEAAFSRAFKRMVSMPPAAWRKAQAGA